MRLFIATEIKLTYFQDLKEAISPYLEANFTKEENLHLTHLFIGKGNLEDFKFKLQIPKETITLNGFDLFDKKILYLRAKSPHIDFINKQLKQKGLVKDQKAFIPHVTIARIKKIIDKEALFNALAPFKHITTTQPFNLYLYQSILTSNGPIYKKLYCYT